MTLPNLTPSPSRAQRLTHLEEIRLLLAGGYELKSQIQRWVLPRMGETGEEFARRITRFNYDNLPADLLKHTLQRISLDAQQVADSSDEFPEIRSGEAKLLTDIVRSLITDGEVNVVLDQFQPVVVPAAAVIKSGDDWLVTHTERSYFPSPLEKEKTERILKIWTQDGIQDGNTGQVEAMPQIAYREEAPGFYWLMNLAYPSSVANLVLSCHLFDLCASAYFQRSYKEAASNNNFVPASMLENELPTGLAHVLRVDEFKFNEPSGAFMDKILAYQQEVKQNLRDLLDVPTEAGQGSSGLSKQLAFGEQNISTRSLLLLGIDVLNRVYERVWERLGLGSPYVARLPETLSSAQAVNESVEISGETPND